jgi:glycosyltransferase involved in cell wall biosynthesis
MNVGIDSHSAEREGEGNSTYCRGLVSALVADRGVDDFTLFTANPAHVFYRSLAGGGRSRVVRVPQGAGIVRLAFALGWAATRARVDCLHAQYFAPFGYHGPLVLTVHDLAYLHMPETFPRGLRVALRVLVPRSLMRATHIITDSEFSRRDITERYGVSATRITVIPAAALMTFRPSSPGETTRVLARYGLKPGFVFALGRLNRRKNLSRLLEAWALLRQRGLTALQLVIAGKPDFGAQAVLRHTRHPSQDGTIQWVGLLPEQDLSAFYSGAAVFVYPSLFEGFGLPILEAMACGAPVVASNRAAMPELLGDAGLLIDPEDVQSMAHSIAQIISDRTLARELSQRGLARSRHYSWAATARHTLAVYHAATHRP